MKMDPINNSNIDERLAAITMNLELLSRDREDDKRRIEELMEATARLTEATARNTDAIARNADAIARNSDDIHLLARHAIETGDLIRAIATATDARLRRLEDKQ